MKALSGLQVNRVKTCDNCANCLYIGEGDYACMAGAEPVIVKEEHIPNENYCHCGGGLWEGVS